MISRRTFISAMKKNGFTYSPKTRLLYRSGLDGNDGLEIIMYIRVATAFDNKEYVTFWVQEKFDDMEIHPANLVATKGVHDYIPFDHVIMYLSMIKHMRNWWFA